MTKQEIFDKVWQHFIVEKNPRAMSDRGCCYRNPEGPRCAVGLFIPDELYDPGMEWRGVSQILHAYPALLAVPAFHGAGGGDTSLFNGLQWAHDTGHTPDELEQKLRRCAYDYGLSIPGEA